MGGAIGINGDCRLPIANCRMGRRGELEARLKVACGGRWFAYSAGMGLPRAVIFDLDETLTDRALSIERFAPQFAAKFRSELGAVELGEIVRCIRAADGNGYASREEL